MSHWDDDEKLPTFERADLSTRAAAGAVDFVAVLLLVSLYFAFPLLTGGAALPIWGVFAAVVGYAVVPLALYGATPAMALFGLEMVSIRGRAPQVTDLLFRELIGRGYFPMAYLGSLFVAFVGMLLGVMRFTMPVGAGFILFLLSIGLLTAAGAGNILAIVRPDGRTLADLVSRTVITLRRKKEAPKDEDDRLEARRAEAKKIRTLVIAELCMVLVGLGLPWLISRRAPGEDTGTYADRLVRERLGYQFAQDPANTKLANDLIWSLRGAGMEEEAKAIAEQHRQARIEKQKKREDALRALLARDPNDQDSTSALLELLENQGRKDDARAVYAAWVEADPNDNRRAGFGIWLYQTGYSEPAIAELSRAFDAGFTDAESMAYRGFANKDLGRLEQAKADFEAALALDPSLYEVESALRELRGEP